MNGITREEFDARLGAMDKSIAASDAIAKAGSAEIRAEIVAMRSEVRVQIAELRAEFREELGNLRSEFRDELGNLRSEFRDELSQMRTDTQAEFAKLRTEMHKAMADTIKWMVGIALTTVIVNISALTFIIRNLT